MMHRTRDGRRQPAAPGGTPAGGPVPGSWAEPGSITGSWVPDWPWASAGNEAMSPASLRAGYGLRRLDIRRLEAAGLLSARRTWSGRLRYVATSGWLPERPRRGARRPMLRADAPDSRQHPRFHLGVSWAGIALVAARGAGSLALLALAALAVLLRLIPWWLLLAAAAVVFIAASPRTLLFAVLAGVAVIKAVLGITRAIAQARQPPSPPPPRPGWW
jgi:hypothetical protein